jgi:hypothetical protein
MTKKLFTSVVNCLSSTSKMETTDFAAAHEIGKQILVGIGNDSRTYMSLRGLRDGETMIVLREEFIFGFLEFLKEVFYEYENDDGSPVRPWLHDLGQSLYMFLYDRNDILRRNYEVVLSLFEDSREKPM